MSSVNSSNDDVGKPRLRGVSHAVSAVFALPAGWALIHHANGGAAVQAATVYAMSLLFLFSVSGLYHVPNWSSETRRIFRSADRSMIYIFVAATYGPLVHSIGEHSPQNLMTFIWGGAAIGVLLSIFGTDWPRFVTSLPYVVLGWCGVTIMPGVYEENGALCFWLIALGGVFYTIGALIYAMKRPNPFPSVFGYHEIFHGLVVLSAGLHFGAIWIALMPPL